MIDLKCPDCSAPISLDETREYGFCSYCGTKIQLVQKVRMMHEGTVNVRGIKTELQQLETARKMIEIGEYNEAERILKKVVEYSPDCGEAWLELLKIKAESLTLFWLFQYINDNYGEKVILSSVSIPNVVNRFSERLTNSSEYSMAKKILGDQANLVLEALIQRGEQRFKKLFQESDRKIQQVAENPLMLVGYQSGIDSQYGFFKHNTEILFYMEGLYYCVKSINENVINLEFRNFSGGAHNVFKYAYIKIAFIDERNNIYSSVQTFHPGTNNLEEQYIWVINDRMKRRKCPICGLDIIMFNCRKHNKYIINTSKELD